MLAHRDIKISLVSLMVLLTAGYAYGGRTFYVDDDEGAQFAAVQDAIDAASDGDVIILRDGVYAGEGNDEIDFGGKAIFIRSQNGPGDCLVQGRFVFCSGEGSGSILEGVTIENSETEMLGGGIYCRNTSPHIVDCVIQDCRANRGGGGMYCFGGNVLMKGCKFVSNKALAYKYCDDEGCRIGQAPGGGVYNEGGNLTLVDCLFDRNESKVAGGGVFNTAQGRLVAINCTFQANTADQPPDPQSELRAEGQGGGLYINYNCSGTLIKDCIFSENKARLDGGGVYIIQSSPTIENCIFVGNSALTDDGGGLFMVMMSDPKIVDCEFRENYANEDGGGIAMFQGEPVITNCIFADNSAEEDGGGMYNFLESRPFISNCRFESNAANDDGGAISNRADSNPRLDGCIIVNNRSRDNGGAIFNREHSGGVIVDCTFSRNIARTAGGAVYNRDRSSPSFINCLLIDNNSNDSGGAIYNRNDCAPELTNCTVVGNSTTFDGGGICNTDDCVSVLKDTILWGNTDDGGADESAQIYGGNDPVIDHCCVQGWTGLLQGAGNTGSDPLFVSGLLGDYYLASAQAGQVATSPCINAGSMPVEGSYVGGLTTTTDHIADVGVVDMGMHYRVKTTGDLSGDGTVDLADFAVIAEYWLETGCGACGGADLSGNDGAVDIRDLLVFTDSWLVQ